MSIIKAEVTLKDKKYKLEINELEARVKELEDQLRVLSGENRRMELTLAEAHAKEAASLKEIMARVETQHKVNELGRRVTDLRGDDADERMRIAVEVQDLAEKAAEVVNASVPTPASLSAATAATSAAASVAGSKRKTPEVLKAATVVSEDSAGRIGVSGSATSVFSKAGSEVDSTVKAKAAELVERIGSLGSSSSCLLYTSPSPRDATLSRMPSSA